MNHLRLVLALSTVALFLVVSIFGLHATMMTDGQGNMRNCPLMNGIASVCRMDVFEHLANWQTLFVATVSPLAALLSVLFLVLTFPLRSVRELHSLGKNFSRFSREDFEPNLFNHIQIALRRGILHPKLYDFSFVIR